MAEERHHHHPHHHHKVDDATRFKRKSLISIKRRKRLKKWLFGTLCVLAVAMLVLVALAYTIG